jgi:hypothetical protein
MDHARNVLLARLQLHLFGLYVYVENSLLNATDEESSSGGNELWDR